MNTADAIPGSLEKLMHRVDMALAGKLSEEETRELAQHLENCSACSNEIERVRLLRTLLKNSCACSAPDSLHAKVRSVRTAGYQEVSSEVREVRSDGTRTTVRTTSIRYTS